MKRPRWKYTTEYQWHRRTDEDEDVCCLCTVGRREKKTKLKWSCEWKFMSTAKYVCIVNDYFYFKLVHEVCLSFGVSHSPCFWVFFWCISSFCRLCIFDVHLLALLLPFVAYVIFIHIFFKFSLRLHLFFTINSVYYPLASRFLSKTSDMNEIVN